jgi:nucleoside-diphosphate-sugar epimerase
MSKYFLTSGTGYIGLAVARAAQESGHEVTALSRSDESASRLQEHGIKVHRGDLQKPETYRDALIQFDAVIHTAAVYGPEFAEVEQQTADAIVNALRGSNKAFIYTSGTWVVGHSGGKPVNEETPANPIPLVAWRPAVEQRVLKAAKDGVRAIVVRPAIVFGRGGGIIGALYSHTKKNGEVPYIGNGENLWSLIHIDDLAKLYVLAAEKAPAGVLLHGTDGKPAKQRQIAEWVAIAAGIPGKVKSQTAEEARKTWGVFAEGLAIDQNVESPNTKRILGWEPKQASVQDELSKNAKEFVSPGK